MYRKRGIITLQTAATVAVYVAGVVATYELLRRAVESDALRLVLALVLSQSLVIVLMLAILLTRRGVAGRRARIARTFADGAHAAVAEHAAGVDRLRTLRALYREAPRDVTAALASFLTATRGTMHERVSALARDLGVSAETIAGQTREWLASSSLYERAVGADAMLDRAQAITSTEFPRIFAKGDDGECIAALDLLRAWQRSFRIEGFQYALAHPAAAVRSRAFEVLPYVDISSDAVLEAGLRDPSAAVRAAAAQAAGRLQMTALIPTLLSGLHDAEQPVALASAFAVARMPSGVGALQDLVLDDHRPVAASALEAIEKATLGRLP